MGRFTKKHVKALEDNGIETFDGNEREYMRFGLVEWNGSETVYARAGSAVSKMINGNVAYEMHGITNDGADVLIAAH